MNDCSFIMFLLLYCLIKRHERYSNATGRNDTMSSRNSITSRRKLRYNCIWTLLMLVTAVLTLLVVLACRIIRLQNLASLSFSPGINWNQKYPIKTVQTVNGPRSNPEDDNVPFVNAIFNTNISSVDYMACCGAGHRISKMADAYYLAKRLKFSLRGYWGYCDSTATNGHLTEVFQYVPPIPFFIFCMIYL